MFIATRTRPDILFAITALAQFSSNPSADHWRLLKRILAYTYSSQELSLCLDVIPGPPILRFYTDSSWASNIEDRKSWSGYVGFLSGVPVTWRVQKQKCIALSTMEAEFISLSTAVTEIRWLSTICHEVDWIKIQMPIVLRCDNESAIAFTKNCSESMQTKHIDLRYKYVREVFKQQDIVLSHVASKDNVADIFTKPLTRVPFERFRAVLVA